jgi:kynureninase
MAALRASLDIFSAAGMERLREKSVKLTAYLEFIVHEINARNNDGKRQVRIITPTDFRERGCQLSFIVGNGGRELFRRLTEHGVVADWREPDVLRAAPVPLYNSFEDVYNFGVILSAALNDLKK